MATATLQKQTYGNFVQAFRAYKKQKREWQAQMEVKLAQEEADIQLKRKALYAEYEPA